MKVLSREDFYEYLRRYHHSSLSSSSSLLSQLSCYRQEGRGNRELSGEALSWTRWPASTNSIASSAQKTSSTLSFVVLAIRRTVGRRAVFVSGLREPLLALDPAPHLPSKISWILTYVPVRKPNTPKVMMAIFFHSRQFHLPRPFSCSQTVTNSITDGNMRPNVDKHTAPTREINGPKLGIAIATHTVKITNRMRRKYSPSNRREPKYCLAFFQIISMGT